MYGNRPGQIIHCIESAFCAYATFAAENPRGPADYFYMSLEPFGSQHSLEELVRDCISRGYKATHTNANTDIHKSIFYHLKLLAESNLVREVV